jgi:hypothetical protein
MGEACVTYGRKERCLRVFFGGGSEKKRGYLEELGVGARVILEWIFMALQEIEWKQELD